SSYVSLTTNLNQEPDLSPSDWQLLAQEGAQGPTGPAGSNGSVGATGPQGNVGATGPAGLSLNNQGNWSSSTTYHLNDFVFFALTGSSYVSLTTNLNKEPDISPSNW